MIPPAAALAQPLLQSAAANNCLRLQIDLNAFIGAHK
jgi:hypothetical protein